MKKIYQYVIYTFLIGLAFILLLLPNINVISFANVYTARFYTAFAFGLICVAVGLTGKDAKFKLIGFVLSAVITYGALFIVGGGIIAFDVTGLDVAFTGKDFGLESANLYLMFDNMIGISATISTVTNAIVTLVPVLIVVWVVVSFAVGLFFCISHKGQKRAKGLATCGYRRREFYRLLGISVLSHEVCRSYLERLNSNTFF
jgi:hypothetical protein